MVCDRRPGPAGRGLALGILLLALAALAAGIWLFGFHRARPAPLPEGVQEEGRAARDAGPDGGEAGSAKPRQAWAEGAGPGEGLIPWRRLDLPPEPEAVVGPEEAPAWMGRTVEVRGRIVETHHSGRACFLNFRPYGEGGFYAVILGPALEEFEAPEERFLHRRVAIRGRVGEYRGRPQIVLQGPEAIRVLDEGGSAAPGSSQD